MVSSFFWLGTAFAAAASAILCFLSRRDPRRIPWIFYVLYVILPFAAGGFHSHVSFVISWCLFFHLAGLYKKNGGLHLVCNFNSIAVVSVVIAFALTPLWAADRGMALFGIVRSFPLLLLMLVFMQYPREDRQRFLQLVPLSGVFMTVLSGVFLLIPGAKDYLTVYSRLSGFLQYPNTFAAFLLAGLIIQNQNPTPGRKDYVLDALLILGILLSGSRTCFMLLIAALMGIGLIRHNLRQLLILVCFLLCSLLLAILAADSAILQGADRFTNIDLQDNSFVRRLLFFKDALKIILRHPFGTGFLGYRALEGLYQSGNYTVTFVHNELLQLLLDIGWIPSLFMAVSLLRTMLSGDTLPCNRLLLVILLGHCMLDFDLQYLLFWGILLSVPDFENGRSITLQKGTTSLCLICTVVLLFSSCLGIADYRYSTGRYRECLNIMPVHTDAMIKLLRTTAVSDTTAETADRVLALYPTCSAAYSAKADAAYASGRILDMIEYKKQAICYSRFNAWEYRDLFQKLYSAMEAYLEAGDSVSAAYCANRLLEIPDMLKEAAKTLDPMDVQTIEKKILTLPEEYLALLDMLTDNFSQ